MKKIIETEPDPRRHEEQGPNHTYKKDGEMENTAILPKGKVYLKAEDFPATTKILWDKGQILFSD